jgi:brefeldin A-inhibited guanine nucleotide-exchange protein
MTKIFVLVYGKLVSVFDFCRFNDKLKSVLSGFMKHLPNLLKQESSSAATLVHVLLRMYYDSRSEHEAARPQIAKQLMPSAFFHFLVSRKLIMGNRLGLGVLQDYSKLRADTQVKNIAAWTPVVAEILEGFCRFDDKAVCVTNIPGNNWC